MSELYPNSYLLHPTYHGKAVAITRNNRTVRLRECTGSGYYWTLENPSQEDIDSCGVRYDYYHTDWDGKWTTGKESPLDVKLETVFLDSITETLRMVKPAEEKVPLHTLSILLETHGTGTVGETRSGLQCVLTRYLDTEPKSVIWHHDPTGSFRTELDGRYFGNSDNMPDLYDVVKIVSICPPGAVELNPTYVPPRTPIGVISEPMRVGDVVFLDATTGTLHKTDGTVNPDEHPTSAVEKLAAGPNVEVHETGAKRGTDVSGLRFDLLSPIVLMSMAGVFAEGAHKYGDHNYLKGFKFSGLMQHAMNHLMLYMLGDRTEDHLGHAAWNINAMIHFSHTKPEMNDLYDHGLTAEQIAKIKEALTFKPQ